MFLSLWRRKVQLLYVLVLLAGVKPDVLGQQGRNPGGNQRTGTDVDAILNKVMMDFLHKLNQPTTTNLTPTTFGRRILPPAPASGQFLQDNSAINSGTHRQRLSQGQTAFYQNVSSTARQALLVASKQPLTTTTATTTTQALNSTYYLPSGDAKSLKVTPDRSDTGETYRSTFRGITTSHPLSENRTMGRNTTSASTAKVATTSTNVATTSAYAATAKGVATTSWKGAVATTREASLKNLSNSTTDDWSVNTITDDTTTASSKTVSTDFRNVPSRNGFTVPQKTVSVSPKPTRLPVLTLSHSTTHTTATTTTTLPRTVSQPDPVVSKGASEPKNGSWRVELRHDLWGVLVCVPVLGLYLL